MRVLAIHSSSSRLGVAVVADGIVLDETVLPPGRQHLEALPHLIAQSLSRAGIELDEVDGFGVATGPGSFSGIRVGIATAKGLALALDKPAAGISSLEILACQALADESTGVTAIDARRGELYVGAYRRTQGRIELLAETEILKVHDLGSYLERFPRGVVLACDHDPAGLPESSTEGPRIVVSAPSPAACGRLALDRIARGAADHLHRLNPIYIRRSDAEEKRDQRLGRLPE